jgi:hypothetical protein
VNKDKISKVLENLNITGKTNAAGTTIDSLVEIQAQVSLAQAQLYANSTSNPALTLQNYQDFNFSGIDWGTSGWVSAVNTVIESKIATDIPKLDDVKKISLSFQSILKKATIGVINSNTDPTIDDYETVTGSKLHLFSVNDITNDKLDDNALLLMNDIVRRKTPDQLNSQLEVDTLATQVDRLMKLASNKSTILFSDLSSMGFTIPSSWSDSNTPSKINKFSELVIAGADSGEAINTWDKVQNIINSQAVISA